MMELRDNVVRDKAKKVKKTNKATTASSRVPGLIIFFARGKEGHAWMIIPGSAGKNKDGSD